MNQCAQMTIQLELPHDFPHQPPKGYSYTVEDFKKNVVAIWICNHTKFDYNGGAPVRSIWGFYNTKTKCYQAPINSSKPGDKVDLDNTRPYTAMPLHLNPLEAAFV